MHYKPSFGGLAHIFKKRIIVNTSTFRELIDRSQTDFIGNLPPDMIKKICKMTKSKEQKKTIIEEVREIFSKTANTVESAAKDINKKNKLPQSQPNSILLKMVGRVIKISGGPLFTLTLFAKQAGKIINPEVIATKVSKTETFIASPKSDRSLFK